jgi:L-lactate permease
MNQVLGVLALAIIIAASVFLFKRAKRDGIIDRIKDKL